MQITSINVDHQERARRKGHSSVMLKNNTLLAAGGNNGMDLNDLYLLPTTDIATSTSETTRSTCATQNWCNLYYDCTDCVARPYCGWCDNECVFIGGGSTNLTTETGGCLPLTGACPKSELLI